MFAPRGTRGLETGKNCLIGSSVMSDTFTLINLRSMRWAWYVPDIGQKRNAYKVLVRQPAWKRSKRI